MTEPEPAPPYSERLHAAFNAFNRYAVPFLRRDLGVLFYNPVAGWVMLLTTRGRKSRLPRPAPLNYAIVDGAVCCIAGFGLRTHWYRNLLADPEVCVHLPLRSFAGRAETVEDRAVRLRAARAVLHAGGWAGFLIGTNPWTASDEELERRLAGIPVIRIVPRDGERVVAGPADPGGWLWVPIALAWVWGIRRALRLLRRVTGCRRDL